MNYGASFTGVTFFQAATVQGANNGTSLDGVNVVLGNDVGAAGSPAQLLNNRDILIGANLLFLTGRTTANGTENVFFESGRINCLGDPALGVTPGMVMNIFTAPPNTAGILLTPTELEIQHGFNISRFETGLNGSIVAANGIQTADPGSGAGVWRLGVEVAAAVAFDATRYIEVDINGTVYQLALAV